MLELTHDDKDDGGIVHCSLTTVEMVNVIYWWEKKFAAKSSYRGGGTQNSRRIRAKHSNAVLVMQLASCIMRIIFYRCHRSRIIIKTKLSSRTLSGFSLPTKSVISDAEWWCNRLTTSRWLHDLRVTLHAVKSLSSHYLFMLFIVYRGLLVACLVAYPQNDVIIF